MALLAHQKQYRNITTEVRQLLDESMDYVGDISGIVINLGTSFSPRQDIIKFIEQHKVHYVSGHQRSDIIGITPDTLTIVEKYKKATRDGTIAVGFAEYNGNRFNVRFTMWSTRMEEHALVAANELKGETDTERLKRIGKDVLEKAHANVSNLLLQAQAVPIPKIVDIPLPPQFNDAGDLTTAPQLNTEPSASVDTSPPLPPPPKKEQGEAYTLFELPVRKQHRDQIVQTLNNIKDAFQLSTLEQALLHLIKHYQSTI